MNDLQHCGTCGSESRSNTGKTLVIYGPVYFCRDCGTMFIGPTDSMNSLNGIGGYHPRAPWPEWAVATNPGVIK